MKLEMEYRTNKRTGDKIGVIGMGTSSIPYAEIDEFRETLKLAFSNGVNYFDLATSEGLTFKVFGEVFEKVRDQVIYQVHFGADYTSGTYGWDLSLRKVKESVKKQLSDLRTDYIDYGFIHCLDEESDFHTYERNGVLDYLLELKQKGIVRHIGFSTHTPKVANLLLDRDLIDMLMLSVNPVYDYEHSDELGKGDSKERAALYRRCEAMGVGVSVMKPYAGGRLLRKEDSPFGIALTPAQCLSYALDRPGVLVVLPGVRDRKELEEALSYLDKEEGKNDYSGLSSYAPTSLSGVCVYCNHCAPCPKGIDIGLANKFYDLSLSGDALAKEHYLSLAHHAGECIKCGHCEKRCPFKVKQIQRMGEISSYFGK